MRVAHVTTAHPPGDNRIRRKECAALVEAGIDVVLVAPDDGTSPTDRGQSVRHHPLPRRRGRLQRFLLGPVDAWRAVRREDPWVVHVHDPELIPFALVWRLVTRRRAVYDAHEDLARQVHGKLYIPAWLRPLAVAFARGLQDAAARGLDAVVAATPAIARTYRAGRVVVVQNFPLITDFPIPAVPETTDDETAGRVVYIGAITVERGLPEMLEAVSRSSLIKEFVLVGPTHGPARELLAQVDDPRVRYVGAVPPDEVPAHLAASQVGLVMLHPLPAYLESQPTKLFEYMAAGIPFVASDFPVWRALVGDVEAGLFVPPRDTHALRQALDALLADPARARAMGAQGRAAIEAGRFVFEGEAEVLVHLTRELLRMEAL